MEVVKWVIFAILLIVATISNYLFDKMILPLRMFIMFILFLIAVVLVYLTKQGKEMVLFIREASLEARRVVWPTCQETLYATLTVIVITFIMSLILWGLDNILLHFIPFFTCLRF